MVQKKVNSPCFYSNIALKKKRILNINDIYHINFDMANPQSSRANLEKNAMYIVRAVCYKCLTWMSILW